VRWIEVCHFPLELCRERNMFIQGNNLTIAHCKTYWFSESIQSKVLSEASIILKVMALQST
jgi:hypothetical protein